MRSDLHNSDNPRLDDLPFEAVLRPHRSLSATAIVMLLSGFAIICVLSSLVFMSAGAWPVAIFLGVDAALLYLAFRLNMRDARRFETVRVSRSAVTLTQYDVRGRSRYRDFAPSWVHVDLSEAADGRTRLALAARGERTVFGEFLTDEERRDFARVLDNAIHRARGAPG